MASVRRIRNGQEMWSAGEGEGEEGSLRTGEEKSVPRLHEDLNGSRVPINRQPFAPLEHLRNAVRATGTQLLRAGVI